jgi:flagellar biosynthesis/type III secretory pathway protein FliH
MRTSSLSKIIKSDKKDALTGRKVARKTSDVKPEPKKSRTNGSHSPQAVDSRGHLPDSSNPADIVAEAEKKAKMVLSEASAEAEKIRREARRHGYEDGLKEADRKLDERIKLSLKTLDSLVNQLKTQQSEMMRLLSPRIADLATEMARRIIQREVSQDASIVTAQAEEAIKKILQRDKLIIRVCPDDEQIMKNHEAALMDLFDGIDKIEIISDPAIEKGGCIVETHLVKVDAQPSSQLKAARNALQGGPEK